MENLQMRVTNDYIFDIIIKILVLCDIFPARVLYLLAQVNEYTYNNVQWVLNKYAAIYTKMLPRFSAAVYKRLIGHPIQYTRRATTIERFAEMNGNQLMGLQLFNTANPPFQPGYLRRNCIAITNVTLWMNAPVSFMAIFILNCHAFMWHYIDESKCTQINPNIYYVQIGVPTERNPILLGDKITPVEKLYLIITPPSNIVRTDLVASINTTHNFDFMHKYINRVIVSYVTVSANEYVWSDYVFGFNGDIDHQWCTTSFIRNIKFEDDITLQTEDEIVYHRQMTDETNQAPDSDFITYGDFISSFDNSLELKFNSKESNDLSDDDIE